MSEAPTPDLIRAVRAGCKAIGEPSCAYPDCECSRVRAIRAALAELEKPSDEMLAEVAVNGATKLLGVAFWRAMMRRVLGRGGDESR